MSTVTKTDEMFAKLTAVWDTTEAVIGYVPEIRWPSNQQREIPDGAKFWARVSQQTLDEEQATLSNCMSLPGKRKYTVEGLIFVQIFGPRFEDESWTKCQKLAEIARNAYRGQTTASKIIFRNARIKELEPEQLFERFNVVVEFEYDEIG
jgi:hypothetical protein